MQSEVVDAVAITAADPATVYNGALLCSSFQARVHDWEKLSNGATQAYLVNTTRQVTVWHQSQTVGISPGQQLVLLRLPDGRWISTNAQGGGGGGGEIVVFEILEESGTPAAGSTHCDDQLRDAVSSYTAYVRWRPCNVATVSEETSEGTIVVHDALGSFLANREAIEAQGKQGVAQYMQEDDGYGCQWVITFIDWWREIQVISDIIHSPEEIRFKVKRVKVWDDCDLDDIVIPLVDCADQS